MPIFRIPYLLDRNDPSFEDSKAKGISGLLEKYTLAIVCNEETEKGTNVLGESFVLPIKNLDTYKPLYKARFVVQGHNHQEKYLVVNSANIIRQHSVIMLVSMEGVFGFRFWSQDVSQAYLQAGYGFMRNLYLKAPMGFQLEPNQLLKLLKP